MPAIAIDLDAVQRKGLADCKAHLSDLVANAELNGESYMIMRYNRPAALLIPVPSEPKQAKARGILSDYADPAKRELESGAWARAMVSKHAAI